MTEKKEKTGQEQREHYRIRYPVEERPTFECQGRQYEVIDLSEKGLAFRRGAQDSIAQTPGLLKGRILFKSGEFAAITGKVLRHTEDTVILILQIGVPLSIIMKEQRQLLQRFGQLGK